MTTHLLRIGFLALAVLVLLPGGRLAARTIVLTAEDCDQMAIIAEEAPRLSWAAYEPGPGIYSTFMFTLRGKRALLIRYPLDKIPKGQAVTNAELVVPINYFAGAPRLQVRRLLADWGFGVCHEYRTVRPKKLKWTKPGARGVLSDVALKPTATFQVTEPKPRTVNVTGDVELWYSGQAANRGWIISDDSDGSYTQMASPLSPWSPDGKTGWKLRITYEPK